MADPYHYGEADAVPVADLVPRRAQNQRPQWRRWPQSTA